MSFRKWPDDHPFFLAMVVMVILVIPGFARIQVAIDGARHAASVANEQIQDNEAIIKCLTEWVAHETDSLQDRDAVNKTARAAAKDLWKSIRGLTAVPPKNGRQALLDSIDRYLKILNRVDRNALINPYPEIESCLNGASSFLTLVRSPVALEPVAFVMRKVRWDDECMGHRVTIRGSVDSDNIHGTDGPDVIFAYSGDDLVLAGKGNDIICARYGDDVVNGGQGFDRVDCGAGDDFSTSSETTISCG